MPTHRRFLLAGLTLLAAFLPSCHRDAAERPEIRLPANASVIIVVLDACRADKLGCYGFPRPTSPDIDAFAADPQSLVFRRAYVQGNWTKPSTASLFTGLYVHQHGLTMPPFLKIGGAERSYRTQRLDDHLVTLAEALKGAGFATLGVVKSLHLVPEDGFAQGFEEYYTPQNTPADDPNLLRTFVDHLGRTRGRVFAYLHLNACHQPFAAPERDPTYMQRYGFPYDEQARRAAGVDFTTTAIKEKIFGGQLRLTADDVRFLHLIYEANLRRVDEQLVGPLLARLRAIGRYDDSLLILTADHGEELYDHGGYAHGKSLWEEVIHVPLILKFPRGTNLAGWPHQVDDIIRSVDLMPSILDLAGVPAPKGLAGRAVFRQGFADDAFSEQGADAWALVRGEQKLVADATGRRWLFDLSADPLEHDNLAHREPDRLAAMEAVARDLIAASRGGGRSELIETKLPPAAVERLRNLGYLPAEE